MLKNLIKKSITRVLVLEAQLILKKHKPFIVAITGTVGKTSTKDAIYAVLSQFEPVRRSPKSFNSELGVPLTILGLPNAADNIIGWAKNIIEGAVSVMMPEHYPNILVLEVGTDRPGDIKEVTEWIKPDRVVVTKLSRTPVHVEAFSSVEDVFLEKGNLVKALKRGGVLILNGDDEDVVAYRNTTEESVLLFGNSLGTDIRADKFKVVMENGLPRGTSFEVSYKDQIVPITLIDTLGEHHSYHVLAALLVAASLDRNLYVASEAFKKLEPTPGRMRLIKGIKESMIIDDTYNSSPVALTESLKTIKNIKAKRKIAVLGDMLELGKFSIDEHKKAGILASESVDILVTVGVRSRFMAEGALNNEMSENNIYQFDDSREAGKFVQDLIKKGDVILVKGSQGIRTERVVEEIMFEFEKKEKLLVRQEKEWQNRK